ncbi:M23 family metallopeptidase [Paenibacillus sediminis]|uniref:Murein DD-endopeptidase MepM/ murein hydrolase activator NlpD n=1 Tax=Paenibacillus sediminis TaxID=664909 RepID=A0ABS4H4C8_9BACL|nr:M23 family metallopeptidase [Paenibacillus sediminis]MBP1937393.1 murein DD-endopeptidase MepM/ murein hydrolase activator NlpD [Paenibacillus sediminis]
MKHASLHQKMTVLVVREAQQPVKQFSVSKPLVIAVPVAAVLSISSLIVSLGIHYNQVIADLEHQLSAQSVQMEVTVTDKDEAIDRLQKEVISLSNEASSMKSRMEQVTELEQQLQQFIKKYGIVTFDQTASDQATSEGKVSSLSWDDSEHVGGEFIAVHENEILNLAQETKDDFQEMNMLLENMVNQVPSTIEKARQTQYTLQGTPNKWPTISKRITSSFGYRTDPFTGRAAFHAGVDIAGDTGDPVYAAGAGKVIAAEKSSSRGNYIIILHPGGLETWYMHLDGMNVNVGENVLKGEKIGRLGDTGRSTGAHLHFQVVKNNQTVDPLDYIK